MRGWISKIQRFSVSDGPGIRTTVFLKGCPLSCLWCHNPETQAQGPSLLYYAQSCALCGACKAACQSGAHRFDEGLHALDREACTGCGACAQVCPSNALELRGSLTRVEDVLSAVVRDRGFYDATGGGLTVSGGEPLFQFAYTKALLQGAKAGGIHTCLDTSGCGGKAAELAPLVDLYLFDIKETDPTRHLNATGVSLEPILKALREVDAAGGKIRLRCPIVPGINDREEHMRAIGKLADSLEGLQGIDLIAYHDLGVAKSDALGMERREFGTLSQSARDGLLAGLRSVASVPANWHQ